MRGITRTDFIIVTFLSVASAFYIYPPFLKSLNKDYDKNPDELKLVLKTTPLEKPITDNDVKTRFD